MLYGIIDSFTNIWKISKNIQIGKPKDKQPLRFQIGSSLSVISLFFWLIMLGAVQFYHQLCLVAEEIGNIVADHILPAKLQRVLSQETIPKKIFFFGHSFAQLLGVLCQVGVSFHICTFCRKCMR